MQRLDKFPHCREREVYGLELLLEDVLQGSKTDHIPARPHEWHKLERPHDTSEMVVSVNPHSQFLGLVMMEPNYETPEMCRWEEKHIVYFVPQIFFVFLDAIGE